MVAALKVYVDFGGSDGSPGTSTDTTALGPPNIRLKTADDATIDAVNPVPRPASSVNRSFWKNCYIKVATAPNTQVDTFGIYTDGGDFGTGINTYIADQYPTRNHSATTGYIKAVGTVGTTSNSMVGSYTGISSKTLLFSYTSGSPLSPSNVNFISESGNILVNIGDTTNYFVLQVEVGTTASPGNQGDETITITYNEI